MVAILTERTEKVVPIRVASWHKEQPPMSVAKQHRVITSRLLT